MHLDNIRTANIQTEVSIAICKHLKTVYPEDVKGVSGFGLTIFHSTELPSTMIQTHDEEPLTKLSDLRVAYTDHMSYKLEFHFATRTSSDKVPIKQYHLEVDDGEPVALKGQEIYRCEDCTIDWTPKVNMTERTFKTKQKQKSRGAERTVKKTVCNDSTQQPRSDDEEMDEDIASILSNNYEIGHIRRAHVAMKPVLYYIGDVISDDDRRIRRGLEESNGEECAKRLLLLSVISYTKLIL